jgi:ribonuclease-3
MFILELSRKRLKDLEYFEWAIGYRFKDKKLLNTALTHSSFANEHSLPITEYNERLEFLGDAVLELISSEYLYMNLAEHPEGSLTRIRATIVRGQALASYARKINLNKYLVLGKGEEASGGRKRVSILANTFEAVIGAIYLDGGYYCAKDFVVKFIGEMVENFEEDSYIYDCKTALQEEIQSTTGELIEYRVLNESGPDHDKTFYVQVVIGNRPWGEGVGKSKKEAEQNAAREALEKLVK